MTKDAKGHGSNAKGATEKVYWHGSPDHDIKEFDPDKTKRGVYGRGIYVTRIKAEAEKYAVLKGRCIQCISTALAR